MDKIDRPKLSLTDEELAAAAAEYEVQTPIPDDICAVYSPEQLEAAFVAGYKLKHKMCMDYQQFNNKLNYELHREERLEYFRMRKEEKKAAIAAYTEMHKEEIKKQRREVYRLTHPKRYYICQNLHTDVELKESNLKKVSQLTGISYSKLRFMLDTGSEFKGWIIDELDEIREVTE